MNIYIIKLQSHTLDIVFTLIVNTIVEVGCFKLKFEPVRSENGDHTALICDFQRKLFTLSHCSQRQKAQMYAESPDYHKGLYSGPPAVKLKHPANHGKRLIRMLHGDTCQCLFIVC